MWAKASMLLLLLNGFLWAGLRSMDPIVLTLVSWLLAVVGWMLARKGLQRIRRHRAVEGESLAQVAYWGNLMLFIAVFLMFSYVVAMGILGGNLLT